MRRIAIAAPPTDYDHDELQLAACFEQLDDKTQRLLIDAHNKEYNRMDLIPLAQNVVSADADWVGLMAGLDLLSLCNVKVQEAREFFLFCQDEYAKSTGNISVTDVS